LIFVFPLPFIFVAKAKAMQRTQRVPTRPSTPWNKPVGIEFPTFIHVVVDDDEDYVMSAGFPVSP